MVKDFGSQLCSFNILLPLIRKKFDSSSVIDSHKFVLYSD